MSGALNLMGALAHLPQRTGRVLRRAPGTRVSGRVIELENDIGEAKGTLFLATDRMLKSLDEGQRTAGMRVFRTSSQLCVSDEKTGQPSDHVRFSDGTFKVVAEALYPGHGLRRYIVAEVNP